MEVTKYAAIKPGEADGESIHARRNCGIDYAADAA